MKLIIYKVLVQKPLQRMTHNNSAHICLLGCPYNFCDPQVHIIVGSAVLFRQEASIYNTGRPLSNDKNQIQI